MQTVEFQHVHVTTVCFVSGNEAAFPLFKDILDDFLCAHFVFHAEKHRNPHRGNILGVFEKLEKQNKTERQRKLRE